MTKYTFPLQESFRALVQPEASFDLVERPFLTGGKAAWLYFIDGYAKDDVMEKVLEFWMKKKPEDFAAIHDPLALTLQALPYIEGHAEQDTQSACEMLLSGALVLLVEGFDSFFIIDARHYPVRSVSEPENERVLRGSRDGFVETLIFNTAMLRRRIRTPQFHTELFRVGKTSGTDVAICYLGERVDQKLLETIRCKLRQIKADALPMGQESLAELLFTPKWWNPFPKVRYTERPDSAAASTMEGRIILLVDNSPSAMILPTSFFDFFQEADDYYFPPLTGSYLRLLRIFLYTCTLFLTPIFYLLVSHKELFPDSLPFFIPKEPGQIPILLQLLILEGAIDAIKMASLSTPSGLGNSLSIIGGLLLGDYAIQAGWFNAQVILYMSFVALANFIQPNYEMGYALKFMRILLLLTTAAFGWIGFFFGCGIILLLLAVNRTVSGKSDLFPLIPFCFEKLARQILRLPIKNKGQACAPNSIQKARQNKSKRRWFFPLCKKQCHRLLRGYINQFRLFPK